MTSRFSLARLRQRDWAIIFIVLAVVGAGLWYWFMYRPTQDRIAELEAEIARLDTQIERGEAARRNLPALRLAVAELEQDRREFLTQLPTTAASSCRSSRPSPRWPTTSTPCASRPPTPT